MFTFLAASCFFLVPALSLTLPDAEERSDPDMARHPKSVSYSEASDSICHVPLEIVSPAERDMDYILDLPERAAGG